MLTPLLSCPPVAAAAARARRALAPWGARHRHLLAPLALSACLVLVFSFALATPAHADVFDMTDAVLMKAMKTVGRLMMLGGLVAIFMAYKGVKEEKGGWGLAGFGVGVIILGFLVQGAGSTNEVLNSVGAQSGVGTVGVPGR